MSETQLSRDIRRALEACGVWVIRTQVVGRNGARACATGERGLPDLYLPGLGHLEVKVGGGRLSKDQVAWHSKAARYGVRVATVRSVSEAVKIVGMWRAEREHSKAMGWS